MQSGCEGKKLGGNQHVKGNLIINANILFKLFNFI